MSFLFEVNHGQRRLAADRLTAVAGARSSVMDKGLAVGGLDQMGGRVSIELVTVESDAVLSSLSTDGVTFS